MASHLGIIFNLKITGTLFRTFLKGTKRKKTEKSNMNKTEEFSSGEYSGDSDVDYSGEEIRECKLYRIKVENSTTGT